MGKKITGYFVLFLLGSSLSWVLKVAFAGRIAPLLQGYEGGSYGYSRSFNNLFSTSNYGILQLNNGLARTPQMGSLSNSFFLLYFFFLSILGVGFYLMPIFLGMYRSRVLLIIRRDIFSVIYFIDASGKTVIFVKFYFACWFCVVVWCGCFCRWNSWNFFACNINETVIKETGAFVIILLFSILSVQMLTLLSFMVLSLLKIINENWLESEVGTKIAVECW